MVTDVAAVLDAPSTFAKEDGAPARSTITLARKGTFKHSRYGKFTIDDATFESFMRNFREVDNSELLVDKEHSPERGQGTEAMGWIKALRAEGSDLRADIEWTPLGESAIRERRYRYISPTWSMAYQDERGRARGPGLLGAGLTNRPHFRSFPAISLSQSFSEEFALAQPEKPHGECSEDELKTRRAKAAQDEDGAEVSKIDAELAKRKGTKDKAGKDKAPPFGKGQKPPFAAAAVAGEEAFDSRARMAEPTLTAEQLTSLVTTFGLDENASPEAIVTAAQTAQERAEKAPGDGQKVVTAEAHTLTAQEYTTLTAQAAAGAQAARTLDERDRDDTFTAAMDAGKVGDGSRETFNTLWEANRDGAKAFLDGLPAQVSTRPTGSSKQAAGETPENAHPERYSHDQRARAYMAEHKTDYETAIFAVEQEAVAA